MNNWERRNNMSLVVRSIICGAVGGAVGGAFSYFFFELCDWLKHRNCTLVYFEKGKDLFRTEDITDD